MALSVVLVWVLIKGPSPVLGSQRTGCFSSARVEIKHRPIRRVEMGSSGSGRFSDYPGTPPAPVPAGSGGGISGGASGIDRCAQAFNVILEDVGNCDYFSNFGTVPSVGTVLVVAVGGARLFAQDPNGLNVGAIPTRFNYLAACLQSGYSYQGVVIASSTSPFPLVSADFVVV